MLSIYDLIAMVLGQCRKRLIEVAIASQRAEKTSRCSRWRVDCLSNFFNLPRRSTIPFGNNMKSKYGGYPLLCLQQFVQYRSSLGSSLSSVWLWKRSDIPSCRYNTRDPARLTVVARKASQSFLQQAQHTSVHQSIELPVR